MNPLSRLQFFSVLFLMLFAGSFYSYSQCPSVTEPIQSFCNIPTPLIADLVATDNGGGVQWFATPTSQQPIASTVPLINGRTYYADDITGVCGTRVSVVVDILGPPVGLNFQGVCVDNPNDATISDLFVVGNNVRWYATPVGGVPLPPSTVLVDNTLYYADQGNPITGCRTSRLNVFVNVGVVPVSTGDRIQEFCDDPQSPPTIADLVTSEDQNNWYATSTSAIPLDPNTPLVNGTSYFASTVDSPCESIERFEVIAILFAPNNSGQDGNIAFCETAITPNQTLDLLTVLGGAPWNDGVWTGPLPTTNGGFGTVDVTEMTVLGSPYVFTYTVSSSVLCDPSSSTVSVSIIEEFDPGIDASIHLCDNNDSVDLFTILEGNPDPGGIWSPTLSSGTGVFDPSVDTAGIYTYTISGVWPCGDKSANVTVTLTNSLSAGVDSALVSCNIDAPVDLFTILGGSPDVGGTWSPVLTSGTGVFDPSVDPEGVYTYTILGTAPCGDDSAIVTVSVNPAPDAGVDGTIDLCNNDDPLDLFTVLGGTPDAGGTWSPVLTSGTGVFDPSVDAAGTYTYTVIGNAPCGNATANITV
ncbi:hypothetical protein, partial [Aequorivita viscosa]|uniref:hypothetical protein n=2 Tax=Aequorivita viscosa TaxID=797419 RepID=UPI00115F94FE